MTAAEVVDCLGLACPLPLIRLASAGHFIFLFLLPILGQGCDKTYPNSQTDSNRACSSSQYAVCV